MATAEVNFIEKFGAYILNRREQSPAEAIQVQTAGGLFIQSSCTAYTATVLIGETCPSCLYHMANLPSLWHMEITCKYGTMSEYYPD